MQCSTIKNKMFFLVAHIRPVCYYAEKMKQKRNKVRNFGTYLYSMRIRRNEPDLADFLRRRKYAGLF